MGRPNKVCAECGKPYEICYVCDTTTRFSWREVTCSIECYTKFLDGINGNLDTVKEYVDETREIEKAEETIVKEEITSNKKKR